MFVVNTGRKKIYPFKDYEYIACAGAGAAGPIYVGAFNALWRRGYANNIKGIGGSSAGSIVALGIALGWRGAALEERVLQQDFSDFLSIDKIELRSIFSNIRQHSGVLTGKELRRWGQQMIAERLGSPWLCFSEWAQYREKAAEGDKAFFQEKYEQALLQKEAVRSVINRPDFEYEFKSPEDLMANAASMIDLRVMGAKVENTRVTENGAVAHKDIIHKRIFSAQHTPNVSIAQAVKASASYPFVFSQTTIDGEHYTDAGVAEYVPFSLFPEATKQGKVLAFDTEYRSLGVPIKHEPLRGHLRRAKEVLVGEMTISEGVRKLLGWLFTKRRLDEINQQIDANAQQTHRKEKLVANIMTLDRGNVGSTDFLTVRANEKSWLIESGDRTVEKNIDAYEKHLAQQVQQEREQALRRKQTPPPHINPPRTLGSAHRAPHTRIHHTPPRNDTGYAR